MPLCEEEPRVAPSKVTQHRYGKKGGERRAYERQNIPQLRPFWSSGAVDAHDALSAHARYWNLNLWFLACNEELNRKRLFRVQIQNIELKDSVFHDLRIRTALQTNNPRLPQLKRKSRRRIHVTFSTSLCAGFDTFRTSTPMLSFSPVNTAGVTSSYSSPGRRSVKRFTRTPPNTPTSKLTMPVTKITPYDRVPPVASATSKVPCLSTPNGAAAERCE